MNHWWFLWKAYAIRTRFIATKNVVVSNYDTLINIHCGKSENSPYQIARNFPLCCAYARIENRTMRNTTKCPSLFILYSVHRSLAITRKYRNNKYGLYQRTWTHFEKVCAWLTLSKELAKFTMFLQLIFLGFETIHFYNKLLRNNALKQVFESELKTSKPLEIEW